MLALTQMKWTTRLFKKLEWVCRLCFPNDDPIPFGDLFLFAKSASVLRSPPSVALSSVAVKAFLL